MIFGNIIQKIGINFWNKVKICPITICIVSEKS